MLRTYLTLLLITVFLLAAKAQTVKGRVIEAKTQIPLGAIDVQNIRTKQHAVTNEKGAFQIEVRVNDLLALKGYNYKTDTVLITDLKPKEIALDPVGHLLKEVDVKGGGRVKEGAFHQYDRDFHGQSLKYQMDDTGGYKGGITIRFWASKKEEHLRQKEERMIQTDQASIEIQKTFSEENIAKYVPLKNEELKAFIIRYVPDVKTYQSKEFDLVSYLNKCYKQFMLLPEVQKYSTKLFN